MQNPSAQERARVQLERHVMSTMQLPTIDLAGLEAGDIAAIIRDLKAIWPAIQDCGDHAPFIEHDNVGVGFATPIGLVVGEMGQWISRQLEAAYAALEMMKPEPSSQRAERLVALISRAIESENHVTFFELVEEYRAHVASR